MAQPDLQTTAINDLIKEFQDNEILLKSLTAYTVTLLNDDLLDVLKEILVETKINNAYLQEIAGERLTESDIGE